MTARPYLIGITGGIGSGKSVVCTIFRALGVPVYDADSRAKALMTTDGILMAAIRREFGELSYHKDGSLNREYLAQKVFSVADRLTRLNSLVHPRVKSDFEDWVKGNPDKAFLLKEAALLFESGSWKELDAIVWVTAPEELRIRRVLSRDPHRTEQQVKDIIRTQGKEKDFREKANHIIVNDGVQPVLPQVLALHEKFSRGILQ